MCDTIPVEQHGGELDDNNGKEEEHKNDTNRLKVEMFFGDEHMGKLNIVKKLIINQFHLIKLEFK